MPDSRELPALEASDFALPLHIRVMAAAGGTCLHHTLRSQRDENVSLSSRSHLRAVIAVAISIEMDWVVPFTGEGSETH